MNGDLVDKFELINDDNIDDHIFDIFSNNKPPSNLGFINKSSNEIEVTLPNAQIDLNIKQSLSQLSSRDKQGTTGFICWYSSLLFSDWLLSKTCPIKLSKDMSIFELGSGVGGICASTISKSVGKFIASDQKQILKLLKENVTNNVDHFTSRTIKNSFGRGPNIEVIEFDWEDIDQGKYNYKEAEDRLPDVIIACDTIYNEYLIPHFINSFKSLLNSNNFVLICIQLRDAITIEKFIQSIVEDEQLLIYSIPNSLSTTQLSNGYIVFYIKLL
ncbi:unnamed protein product [Candida verbasci]|uniref:Ribosomal lysine N-methyltransferase 5 n=1 Tax=Candida verbasci TaxID=1227364 RepID=A0A9W4TU24_9ASCO|nr:unnamed protein product [Candida verbasci]